MMVNPRDLRIAVVTSGSADDTVDTGGDDVSDEIVVRLRRVEGQIRGIQRMITDGNRSSDVLTQISAARAALDAAGLAILDARLHDCLNHTNDRAGTAELVTAVERFVRR